MYNPIFLQSWNIFRFLFTYCCVFVECMLLHRIKTLSYYFIQTMSNNCSLIIRIPDGLVPSCSVQWGSEYRPSICIPETFDYRTLWFKVDFKWSVVKFFFLSNAPAKTHRRHNLLYAVTKLTREVGGELVLSPRHVQICIKIDSPLLGFEPGSSPEASRHANH